MRDWEMVKKKKNTDTPGYGRHSIGNGRHGRTDRNVGNICEKALDMAGRLVMEGSATG